MRKSYGQYCALARALDRIGDRWTLLIVRELLIGPSRFVDLRAQLPGIATNLLALRLRQLETDDLIRRRRVEPPSAATVYELTDAGRELEAPLFALIRWGGRWMRDREDASFDPRWLALALQALLQDREPPGRLSAAIHAEGAVVAIDCDDDSVRVHAGAPEVADIVLETDAETMLGIASGKLPISRAAVRGRRDAIRRLRRLLENPSRPATTAMDEVRR